MASLNVVIALFIIIAKLIIVIAIIREAIVLSLFIEYIYISFHQLIFIIIAYILCDFEFPNQ